MQTNNLILFSYNEVKAKARGHYSFIPSFSEYLCSPFLVPSIVLGFTDENRRAWVRYDVYSRISQLEGKYTFLLKGKQIKESQRGWHADNKEWHKMVGKAWDRTLNLSPALLLLGCWGKPHMLV